MVIDFYQDTVCPWCRIGKRHLKLALERWDGEPVEVNYRSFFLNPAIPPEGYEFASYMQAKGGGKIPLETFFDAPRRMGAAAGLVFNFEKIQRAPNSLLSHQLAAIAPPEKREAVLEALFTAYFERGQDIGDLETLVKIASGCGLEPTQVREQLTAGVGAAEVQAEAEWAQRAGIRGVPFFLINGQYGFSGAQPPEVILSAMRQVAAL